MSLKVNFSFRQGAAYWQICRDDDPEWHLHSTVVFRIYKYM